MVFDTWRELRSYERDVLLELYHADRPRTGTELYHSNEDVDGRTSIAAAYRNLRRLESDDLLESHNRDDKSIEYELSAEGFELVGAAVHAIKKGDLS